MRPVGTFLFNSSRFKRIRIQLYEEVERMKGFGSIGKVTALVFLISLFAIPAFGADPIKVGEIATVTGDFTSEDFDG